MFLLLRYAYDRFEPVSERFLLEGEKKKAVRSSFLSRLSCYQPWKGKMSRNAETARQPETSGIWTIHFWTELACKISISTAATTRCIRLFNLTWCKNKMAAKRYYIITCWFRSMESYIVCSSFYWFPSSFTRGAQVWDHSKMLFWRRDWWEEDGTHCR